MVKVKLCYTAHNADSDWFEREVLLDETNYEDVIRDYVEEFKEKAEQLNNKWLGEDILYLNFRMEYINPTMFRLIDNFIEDNF